MLERIYEDVCNVLNYYRHTKHGDTGIWGDSPLTKEEAKNAADEIYAKVKQDLEFE